MRLPVEGVIHSVLFEYGNRSQPYEPCVLTETRTFSSHFCLLDSPFMWRPGHFCIPHISDRPLILQETPFAQTPPGLDYQTLWLLLDKCHMQPGKYPPRRSPLACSCQTTAANSSQKLPSSATECQLKTLLYSTFQLLWELTPCHCGCSRSLYYLLHVRAAAGENYTPLQIPPSLAGVLWNSIFCTLPVHFIHTWWE